MGQRRHSSLFVRRGGFAAKAGSDLDEFGELVDAFLFERAREDAVEAHEESVEEFVSELQFEFAQRPLAREGVGRVGLGVVVHMG
jgi:hypothetical protein